MLTWKTRLRPKFVGHHTGGSRTEEHAEKAHARKQACFGGGKLESLVDRAQ